MIKKNILKRINSTSLLAIILIIANSIYLIDGINTAPLIKGGKIAITFLPIIISILFYVPAIYLFITGIRERSFLSFNLLKIGRPSAVIFSTFIYVLIFKTLGYILSSVLYVFCLMLLFEDETGFKKKIFLNIVYSIVIVTLIYLLYQKLFGVRLPIGEMF